MKSAFMLGSRYKQVFLSDDGKKLKLNDILTNFNHQYSTKIQQCLKVKGQLIKKIEMEGKYTDADILLTVDVARLIAAKNKGLFKKINKLS